jgi:transcriptional regulator with XRE-family HTH domain
MLMKELERRRVAEGVSVTDFAKALGIDRSYYYMMLSGRREVSNRVLKAALRRYPELGAMTLNTYAAGFAAEIAS